MSRTVKRRRRPKKSGDRRLEALGIVILLVALVLLLSLLSYSPTDPPAFDSAVDAPKNWMGIVGALLAFGMVQELGRFPPLLTIAVIFVWGWRLLRHSVDRSLITLSVKILGIQVLLSILLAFPHYLISQNISYDLAGRMGGSLAGIMFDYTGRVGAPLVWASLLMLFLIGAFGWRPGEIAGGIAGGFRATGAFLLKSTRALAGFVLAVAVFTTGLAKRLTASVAARRAGKAQKAALETGEPAVGEEIPADLAFAGMDGIDVAGEGEPVELSEKPAAAEPDLFGEIETDMPEPVAPAKPVRPFARRKTAGSGAYEPPSLGLFANPTEGETGPDEATVRKEAELLQEKLLSFGVKAEVTGWKTGPVITRFEIKPAPGVKVNQIVNLADDLALTMRAKRIRIVAPIPGKAAVGVEIPNPKQRVVRLREILESESFAGGNNILPLALGQTISGEPFVADLAGMPHLLLAGTTGSGKSVCINGIIASILYRMGPEECRFIMVDPKMLELGIYNSIPHLITPVVTDPKKAVEALRWAVYEMEDRYDTLAAAMVRDLEQYNSKVHQLKEKAEKKKEVTGPEGEEEKIPEPLPYIVIIVDELADVMMTAVADIETLIQRLAQKARAVGIHLILATQRPSVDVITGPIKTNFSSRIAFQVPSKTDSRTILDLNGAEKLLGRGDMLFMNPSFPEPLRIHGSFLSNDEIERLVNLVREQELQTEDMDIFAQAAGDVGGMGAAGEVLDSMLRDAASVVVTHDQGSISLIQRRLGVGYTRAARMMDQLEMLGVVGPPDGTKARKVLMEEEDLDDLAWGGR